MPVPPRIVNDVSYVTDINHENHFSWQAQYLVMSECHFSWQAQYSVKFEEIAGARNVVIFNTKCVSEARKVTSANGCTFAWQAQYLVRLEGDACSSAHCK